MRYRKAKPKPTVAFPFVRSFNETITMALKFWPDSPKVWFLHIIDRVTRYTASCVVGSKKKVIYTRKDL